MEVNVLTPGQLKREKRNAAIRCEYETLISREGQSRTEVIRFLMKKYDIFSMSTIYGILKKREAES